MRDYFFINANLKLNYLNHLSKGNLNVVNYTDSGFEYLFNSLNKEALIYLKWGMSLFYCLIFYSIGLLYAYIYLAKHNFKLFFKLKSSGLILLIFTAIIFHLLSYYSIGDYKYNLYYISLEFSHFAQSSLFPLVFLIAFYAYTSLNSSS